MQHAGTRVRIPSREDVRGHYLVREALEVAAARLFADTASAEERAGLIDLAAHVDALSAAPDSCSRTLMPGTTGGPLPIRAQPARSTVAENAADAS